MGTVLLYNVVSLDGFVADPDDGVDELFDWYFNGDVELGEGGGRTMKVTQTSADYVKPLWAGIGATVIGRHLFDMVNGWEGQPPTGDHVVVVSHRPKPEGWHPEASFHFVDDVTRAVAKAKELADGRTVCIAAGDVGGQALALGLVDEVGYDIAPVILGRGKRFFGPNESVHVLDDPHVVIQGNRVLHLRYRVRRT